MSVDDPVFELERRVAAPRERVWRAWTVREELAQWWGPKGFGLEIARLDLRPGGLFLYKMLVPPDDRAVWGRFVYRAIVPPERLEYVLSFSDADGGITRHWLVPTWPREMGVTVTFEDDGDGTRLRLQVRCIDLTETERRTFAEGMDGMRQGFGGTFDQLDAFLARQRP